MYMESREQHQPVCPTGFAVGRPRNKVFKRDQIKRRKRRNKRLRGFISSMPWHAIFAFLNPLLIGALQVKCQGAALSPFDAHQRVMWTFLLTTFVYCFAFAANMKSSRNCNTFYSRISGHIALLTGSLSSVSLVSFFLAKRHDRWIVFFLWIILPLLVARKLFHSVCQKLCKATRKGILSIWHGVSRRNLTEPLQLPV